MGKPEGLTGILVVSPGARQCLHTPKHPRNPYLCAMIALDHTLLSEDLLDKQFACDLGQCQGACCVEGDEGAPLEKEEVATLKEIYPSVAPYLRAEGRATIEKQGTSCIDPLDNEPVTPLVEGRECAYAVFENGTALCGIEKAWQAGATTFRKPLSCHLYPIRITKYPDYHALNYHQWPICDPACSLGATLKIPVYRFAREALIRAYGQKWYAELEEVAEAFETQCRQEESPRDPVQE